MPSSDETARQDAPFLDAVPAREPRPATFRRAMAGTVLGTVVPGLGLVMGRRRRVGVAVLVVFLVALHLLVLTMLLNRNSLLALALDPAVMRFAAVTMVVLALVWVGVIVLTHLCLRPARLTTGQRSLGAALVAALAFVVSAPLAVGSVYAATSANSVDGVFKSSEEAKSATRPSHRPTTAEDPWKGVDRVNVLLLGGDSDGGRREGVRTDTVIVASIDPHSGDTTLISLPRNTARMPFPEDSVLHEHFPYGFTDGNGANAQYMLNAMYGQVPAMLGDDVLGETDNVGADVLKLSVGEALGLQIHYYVLVDIKGFSKLINALGGITVNINERVAVGGSTDAGRPPDRWLEPGPDQHLNGKDAMWFARGRYGSDDFARMDRQRCVIDAIIRQVNPTNVVSRYEAIVREGGDLILTDITQEELPAFVELGLRVKGGQVRSLVFKNGVQGFYSGNPDFEAMRERVAAAIDETAAQPDKEPSTSARPSTSPKSSSPSSTPSSTPSSSPSSTPSSTPSSSPSGSGGSGRPQGPASSSAPPASEDTSDACAYHPE